MKYLVSLLTFVICCIKCVAQTYIEPVFDRTDVPSLHINKIEVTKDTTYVYCTYTAIAGSWARISRNTYLYNPDTRGKFQMLKSDGLPISPQKREFPDGGKYQILFCFASIGNATRFDFIEDPNEKAFNIYGIKLTNTFNTSYTETEIKRISDQSLSFDTAGDTIKAIQYKEEEKKATAFIYGVKSEQLLMVVYDLCSLYEKYGFNQEANDQKKKITDYIDALNDNLEKWHLLTSLSNVLCSKSDFAKALDYSTKAVEIGEKLWGAEHPKYASSLHNLSRIYYFLGNYEKSIQIGTEVAKIRKKVLGPEHSDYAIALSDLSLYYSVNGDYAESIQIGTEAGIIIKKVLGSKHPDYATSLNNLALNYSNLGNYEEAIRLGTEALSITETAIGTVHLNYVMLLNNLANYYSDLGNYTEALTLCQEVLGIMKKIVGIEHPAYARALNSLAAYYSYLGHYKEAIQFGMEALQIRKMLLGSVHPNYAISLSNLAMYYSALGNYEEAVRLEMEALEITKKTIGSEHPRYATLLDNLAGFYSNIGNNEEAIRLAMEALEIRKNVFGMEHPDYATSLNNVASYYSNQGNHTEAYLYFKKCIESFQTYILHDMVKQSSKLKESFWNKYKYRYTKALPSHVYNYNTQESIVELYDKTCLFAKGLLLNSDIELRKLILESGDSILIDKYNALSTNINIYNKLIEKPINERFMNADSLNNVIQQQEMELARESKVYGDYTRNLISTWKDVRNHLDTDDIAIEFIDFPILGTDSVLYAALTLKKDYESPHMVTLFEKKQLKAVPESAYYTQTDIYDLIWKPLEEELGNVHNIYFAPSGELHRIGIEYIPANLTENISDKYSLHRLSSTRQLALIQDNTKGEKSILYGGINYDENNSAVPDTSTSSVGGVMGINVIYRSNVDSLLLRSSYEYLEGTKMEVDQIANQMKQHQVHYQYYSGSEGSEESFKKLDGTKPKVMHIATHGFYLTEEEAKLSNFARPHMELMMGDNQRAGRLVEDKPMTRSGLLFSGCNHAIHHEQIPDGVEDGILTAQEISTLDLRGLDLVVLSACQTALGDIASGEGVFGLQRGFKKAGAKTIIMSLWKVDDEATRILMVELYKNLMSGKSKQQSLQDAQKYLREYNNGEYDKPEYWASFIMLDGLN